MDTAPSPAPSPLKLAANRRNAKRSTGPRSTKGKALASKNATKHGLTARAVVTADENADDFDAYRAALVGNLAPVGTLEEELAERVAGCSWRLRRAIRLEAMALRPTSSVLDRMLEETDDEKPPVLLRTFRQSQHTVENVGRYERAIEGAMYRALHELQRLQAARAGEGPALPMALDVGIHGGKHAAPMPDDEIPF